MTKPAKNLSPLNHFTVVTGELIIIWKFNPLMLGCNKIWYTLKWTCSFQLLVCLSVCNYLLPPCMKRLKSISVPIRIHCQKNIFCSIRVFFHRHWRFTWQQGERGGPSFIPLYHFHPLTNIETFICNFGCEMTITYL